MHVSLHLMIAFQPTDNAYTSLFHFRLMCEAAGKMQGLLPGDLGDLGRASLGNSQIESLIT